MTEARPNGKIGLDDQEMWSTCKGNTLSALAKSSREDFQSSEATAITTTTTTTNK